MKWILAILLLVSASVNAQIGLRDDSTKYIRYQNQYGSRLPRYWADSALHMPYFDTAIVKPQKAGAIMMHLDKNVYKWNGGGWEVLGSGVFSLSNVGSGFAWATTPNGSIKRFNPTYGLTADSATSNTIGLKADTSSTNHLVTQSDLNDAVAAASGNIRYTDVAYVDSAFGSDVTGALNRLDKPFATIDAALDAGASRPSLHIKVGFGSYTKPTPAKMRAYLWLEGSGKPGHNGVISMTGYAVFSNTAPTKLTGGTIILGKIQSIDHSFVKISDLGVDQGSAYVAGGGTENDGIGMGVTAITTPFTLMQGLEISNVICLLKDPSSLFHGIVIENHIGLRVTNSDVIFGTHGIVSKGVGGTITNCKVSDCATDAFIIKSDDYAYSWATQLTNFECASIFSSSCGGVYILASTGPAHAGIMVSNGMIRQCTYGVQCVGVNDALKVDNVEIQGGTGIGFNFDAVAFVQVSNCFSRGTAGDGFKVNSTSAGHMLISNCMSVGNGGDGFDLSTSPGSIEVENCSANSNSAYGFNFGNNVYVNTITYTSNSAGNVNGTPTYQLPYLTRANTFIQRNIFNGSEVQVGSATDQGAYSLQNTGGLYQDGAFLLKPLTAPPSTYNVLVHGLTDSIVYQVPASALSGITSINSQTGPAITISAGTAITTSTLSNDITIGFDKSNTDVPHILNKQFSPVGNTGTGETDLYTYTLPANKLNSNGQSMHLEMSGLFNDATSTVALQFYFAGTSFANTGALTISSTGIWSAQGYIIRTNTTTATAWVTITNQFTTDKSYTFLADLTGLDFTTTNVFKVTGQAGGAGGSTNDITAKNWVVKFEPIP